MMYCGLVLWESTSYKELYIAMGGGEHDVLSTALLVIGPTFDKGLSNWFGRVKGGGRMMFVAFLGRVYMW